jgi:iron complex outermembrane receptor protein
VQISSSPCATPRRATNLAGALLDTRARNLGTAEIGGLDFSVNYLRETGFGSIDASFAGNLSLQSDVRSAPGGALNDDLAFASTLSLQATLGANIGDFRIQGTLNHVGARNRVGGASVGNFGQARIDAFNTVDLYMKYDFKSEGALKDLSLTLNIQNLFDTNPPLVKANSSALPGFGLSDTFTLGRYFQLGLRKKF